VPEAIIDGLDTLGLEMAEEDGRKIKWRWVGRYRETNVVVELLCPVRSRAGRPEAPAEDTHAEMNVGPGTGIAALAVGLGHLVLDDTIAVTRRVETARGGLSFEFPVAGITSWLCLKRDALMRRDKPKDAYDVVWTLDALGPDEASDAVATSSLMAGPDAVEVREQLALLVDDFRDEDPWDPAPTRTSWTRAPSPPPHSMPWAR